MNDREVTMLVNSLVDRDEWDAVECIRTLQSRLESLEKDAARYRWLKNNGRYNGWRVEQEKNGWMTTHSTSTLDEAIDTAMQANKGE